MYEGNSCRSLNRKGIWYSFLSGLLLLGWERLIIEWKKYIENMIEVGIFKN